MKALEQLQINNAIFDETRKYRYVLSRVINDALPSISFIMLNPSTANENNDDPTIRRIKRFIESWGYGIVYIVNLFAYSSSDPFELKTINDPVGPMNNYYLGLISTISEKIIAAWGTKGNYMNRANQIIDLLPKRNKLYCLERTKDGYPKHPLYVKKEVIPQPFGWKSKGNDEGIIRKRNTL